MGSEAKKKRQHYVWQFYLAAWETREKVCCWFKGKRFPTGTKNLGVETYFYALRPLDPGNDELIAQLIKMYDPLLKEVANGWHEIFKTPGELAKLMGVFPDLFKKTPQDLFAAADQLEEELHCCIEHSGARHLGALRSGTLPTDADMPELVPFLTTQYTRTKAIEESVRKATKGKSSPIWQVMRHVFASNIAMGILRAGLKPDILEAPDGGRFITGDQPIINAKGIWLPQGQEARELELYYPVSPTRALVIGPECSRSTRTISGIELNARNANMAKAAFEQVYAQEDSDLGEVSAARGVS